MALCFLACAIGCSGDQAIDRQPVAPGIDAAVDGGPGSPDARVASPPPATTAPKPDAAPPPPPDAAPAAAWSDVQKCENMCQSYCVHKSMCDGSAIDACRMAIDTADGGTCPERARLFTSIAQSQVQACIDAIEAMSCPDFLHMYDTGEGVPKPCYGILI